MPAGVALPPSRLEKAPPDPAPAPAGPPSPGCRGKKAPGWPFQSPSGIPIGSSWEIKSPARMLLKSSRERKGAFPSQKSPPDKFKSPSEEIKSAANMEKSPSKGEKGPSKGEKGPSKEEKAPKEPPFRPSEPRISISPGLSKSLAGNKKSRPQARHLQFSFSPAPPPCAAPVTPSRHSATLPHARRSNLSKPEAHAQKPCHPQPRRASSPRNERQNIATNRSQCATGSQD